MNRGRDALCCWILGALAACGGGGAGGAADAGPPSLPPPPAQDAGPMAFGDVFGFDEIMATSAERAASRPAAAWTGSHHLVVWVDHSERLRARSVAADGSVDDTVPLVLAHGHDVRHPRIACTGGTATCAILWSEGEPPDATSWLLRVAEDGSLLDGAPVALARGSDALCAAFDSFLVLASDGDALRVTRLAATGPLLDDPGLVVVANPAQPPAPGATLACDAAGALVAYGVCDPGSCEGRVVRVDADGSVGAPRAVLAGLRPTAIAAGAGGFLLAAAHESVDVVGLRLDATGAPVDVAPFTVIESQLVPLLTDQMAIGFDGDSYLVATQQALTNISGALVIARRVAPDGTVTPDDGVLYVGATNEIDAAFAVDCGDGHCVSAVADAGQIELMHIAGLVRTLPSVRINRSANSQSFPALASSGEGYLAAWQDLRDGSFAVHAARLSGSGVWLDAASLALGRPSVAPTPPRVAWNGDAYQVTWTTYGTAYGARVAADGTLLQHDLRLFDTSDPDATLACGSGVCMVAGELDSRQVVWRLGPDGRPLDAAGIDLGLVGPSGLGTALAYRDGVFVVAWDGGDGTEIQALVATRLAPDGTILDAAPVPLTRPATEPAITATADDFVVGFTADLGSSAEGFDVGFAILGDRGGVLAQGTLAASAAFERGAVPVFDGANVLVPWTESSTGGQGRVMLRRVHPSGVLREFAPLPLSQVVPAGRLAAASRGQGDSLVVWDAFDDTPGLEATRLALRLVHE